MGNVGKCEKIIKISGKVDKSNTYDGFSSKFFLELKETLLINPL